MASSSLSRSRRTLRTPPRATRAKPTVSYTELSSNSEGEDSDDNAADSDRSSLVDASLGSSPRKTSRARTRSTFQSPTKKRHRPDEYNSGDTRAKPSKRRRAPAHKTGFLSQTKNQPSSSSSSIIQSSSVIPPWHNLPYQILVQIFQYATYPLYDPATFFPNASGSWLFKVGRLCRSFAEPAFTVLYNTPPLVPMDKAHKLVEILLADPKHLAFKYRQKVESLHIEVFQVAAYSLAGSGHLDLHGLIRTLPRLAELEFYHVKDMAPYRDLDDNLKWHYPEDLFDALEYVDPVADPEQGDKTSVCKLRSWRWSSRMAGKVFPIERLREIHLKPSFEGLRKIAFVNYQIPDVKPTEEVPNHEKVLAGSLSVLKNLEHLVIESSTLVNGTLLPLLPKNLRNLELINCWNVKADEIADFLLTHGSQLRCLTLNHNQSLSLSFLPVLGTACPKLQVFRMNLRYYQLHSSYRDSDPLYADLLLPGQVPSWPTTLQTIDLIQLRQWENEAAEMFFQSLLDSAADLPDLRKLAIQAILNIGWRDRAAFRDKWLGSMDRVFRRVSSPPRKHAMLQQSAKEISDLLSIEDPQVPVDGTANMRKSLRSSTDSSADSSSSPALVSVEKETIAIKDAKLENRNATSQSSSRPTRRTAQRAQNYAESPENSDNEEEEAQLTGPSARELARSTRAARELASLKKWGGKMLPSSPPKTHSEEEDSEDIPLHKLKEKGKATKVIQGMCEIVDVRIDNLRPRETQVTEADFLDEEAPGDGDWNGDDEFDEGYAW